jgi:hypothetical protein
MAGARRNARGATVRRWLARHALGLWFLAIAALGFMRWWMKVGREGASMQTPDVALWLAGSIVLAVIGLLALWRAR